VSRVQVGLLRRLVDSGPGISEELKPTEIDRLLVGGVIWREGKIQQNMASIKATQSRSPRSFPFPGRFRAEGLTDEFLDRNTRCL